MVPQGASSSQSDAVLIAQALNQHRQQVEDQSNTLNGVDFRSGPMNMVSLRFVHLRDPILATQNGCCANGALSKSDHENPDKKWHHDERHDATRSETIRTEEI